MKALILAAGVGRRLHTHNHEPKCLLEFNSRSLLARHLDTLAHLKVHEVELCLGYQQEKIIASLPNIPGLSIRTRYNPHYREGSMISLWTLSDALTSGEEIILMDADVLYETEILRRLITDDRENLLLSDRAYEQGDEPVKVCQLESKIVEFRKQLTPDLKYDTIGESVGFFRFSATMAEELAKITKQYLERGERNAPCEEAIRDLVLSHQDLFAVLDITGLKWIEIDFPNDVDRAAREILPQVDKS